MVLIDIIEEHLEEADFLCQQRGNALGERAYNLDSCAELEERLLVRVDGLLRDLCGAVSWSSPFLSGQGVRFPSGDRNEYGR